ncbi:Rv0361 family membrane protein [Gordonia crocea]|uniref:Lipoprotein n=1 Tax=Gordonia crocea TaxID=589162 RepID=A0A7I9V0U6_9ACTN|nr:hypothetical protein nbrc107697_27190 [Gordonia crocea]
MKARRRMALGALGALALVLTACGTDAKTPVATGQPRPSTMTTAVATVVRDAAASLAVGDVDGFLAKQCPQVRSQIAADPQALAELVERNRGIVVESVTGVDISGDNADAQVVYTHQSDPDYPSWTADVPLVRADGGWQMCG